MRTLPPGLADYSHNCPLQLFSKIVQKGLDNNTLIVYSIHMNAKDRSILHQKTHGTYKRNELIRQLHAEGENCAELGRQFRLTRQAVRKIVSEGNSND